MPKGDGEGNSNHIRTFLRIRPSTRPSGFIKIDEFDKARLDFHVPLEHRDSEYVNNTRTTHKFKFDGVLGEKSTQEDVFAKIGKGAVANVLDGYNSTVFAYGQTGSGKTFTITGGAERYVDRGIIPRALSLMFAEFKARNNQQFTCHVSYLEIYNEQNREVFINNLTSTYLAKHTYSTAHRPFDQGFDLLDPTHDSKRLEDLPKVSLMEDEGGNIHLRNLSLYLAANEEEALNYLFLGDTNRAISETAMNKASSRSHCIFTISVEGRKPGSEKVMRSKLHLVDLAGSERVHKTQTGGQTLVEARHINVSLFFLEMVIVALHERGTKGRQHIPYRNSMMTSVLRDSLGGNCKTVMIATVNAEAGQTEESISTCRFAQRVSTIKNEARINEDVDPSVLIRMLRSNNAALEDEVAFLKGEVGEGEELTSEEIEDLRNRCRTFVEDPDPKAQLSIGSLTLIKLKLCFSVFKNMVLGRLRPGAQSRGEGGGAGAEAEEGTNTKGSDAELVAVQDALRQRDSEIAILVNMLKQGKCHACAAAAASAPERRGSGPHDPGKTGTPPHQLQNRSDGGGGGIKSTSAVMSGGVDGRSGAERVGEAEVIARSDAHAAGEALSVVRPTDTSILGDPQSAFGYFRERHPSRTALEENKSLLSEKYTRAKAMGERVNQARSTIQYLKSTIEQIRRERALDGFMQSGSEDVAEGVVGEDEEEEARCKAAMEVEKRVYKDSFQELRQLKSEIEHIQRLLEKARAKMQTDFQVWYEAVVDATDTAAETRNTDRGETTTPVGRSILPAPHSSVSAYSSARPPGARHQKSSNDRIGGVPNYRPRRGHEGQPREGSVATTATEGSDVGSRTDVCDTPDRRPRPPVDAWGTPPNSSDKNMGDGRGAGGAGGGVTGGLLPSLTGNKEADEDITAFYRAKEELERRKSAAGK